MIRFAPTFCAALIAAPLWAAELNDRYEQIGTLQFTRGGETLDLVIPYDTERDRAYAEQKVFMGSYLTINVLGRSVDETGKPGSPMVQVTLQKRSGEMAFLTAELFDEQGYSAPLSMGPDGGKGTLTSFEMTDDNAVSATIEGEMLRLQDYTGEPKVAEGATPEPVTISFSAQLAPLED
ncbi:hypothetical protein [Roseovarius aestuariivivens]|uniref:hypothetical protein n=1 Tax=Roseovarius aestuariivivens TaxID=1888910 RepID=UPI001080BA58|nr:hypothetical protein [Roseovarius aestuariivivens]